MAEGLNINPEKTAVVVIDLQNGITAMKTEPYSAEKVIENTVRLLDAVRKKGMTVFLVNVGPSPDMKDALHPLAEITFTRPYDASWCELVPQLNVQSSDILITKHQWGAFYDTGLDLQLRRRGIDTIILCGIATNIGVESTARYAYERGYNQIFVEDALSARSAEEHEYPLKYIFPRIGLIRDASTIIDSLE
jgi:nicotinamidase-related amidase